jgi:diguanylate cyclase (GGDEF)-like protein/PAS domain S-box-containing protein
MSSARNLGKEGGLLSSDEPALEPTSENTVSAKAAYQDRFDRSIDSILLVDMADGRILEANPAAKNIFKVAVEKLHGTTIYDHCEKSFSEELKKMLRIASRRYHPKTFKVPLSAGSEHLPIITEMAASPLKLNDHSEVLQLIFRDITEKRETDQKIADYIMQIAEANHKLEELATTDGMTGLLNFRQFTKILETEHQRAERYGTAYTIIFCDIDHFKKYNDFNGHPGGDALLRHFAKVLTACVRTTDIVARYGGEEFVVLCPQTDIEHVYVVAERIRTTVASIKYPNGEKQPLGFVSVSVGVGSFPQDGATAAEVLKSADEMLYRSKNEGRNRVTLSKGKGRNQAG